MSGAFLWDSIVCPGEFRSPSGNLILAGWHLSGCKWGMGRVQAVRGTYGSWPRDQTWVSSIAGRLFTVWATRWTLAVVTATKELIITSQCSLSFATFGWLKSSQFASFVQGRGEDPACHKLPQKIAQRVTWFKGQSNPATPKPSSSWLASSCGIAPSLLLSSDTRETPGPSTSLCPPHCYVHGFGFWNLELFSYWMLIFKIHFFFKNFILFLNFTKLY